MDSDRWVHGDASVSWAVRGISDRRQALGGAEKLWRRRIAEGLDDAREDDTGMVWASAASTVTAENDFVVIEMLVN
ncbi:hypothetical protein M0R45_015337 [Rubus argutus]|uniref:Uncharacterized protein n=1 Tax=Rubus argutus TaxID=59490 RepID=A0AAW1XRR8_RUBAR